MNYCQCCGQKVDLTSSGHLCPNLRYTTLAGTGNIMNKCGRCGTEFESGMFHACGGLPNQPSKEDIEEFIRLIKQARNLWVDSNKGLNGKFDRVFNWLKSIAEEAE